MEKELAYTPITRSPAQKPAHKDLGRNGQSPAITPKATYAPASNRAGSRLLLTIPTHSSIIRK
ncbi:acetyltransferase [Lactobacillus rhamnosus]|uniref:Acetyltransferase n=1 Tax=Lacticaseibacillus rhamnosus TaxID=47715 RepID=A0A7Y7UIV7_LACRH|nr:acetyltransferase [Lacticaseibacillus rhamnosus]OFM41511.1 acetyltransferase [Lactobacillus sp. HMSC077C11]